jgi:hypothetical protein
MIKLIKIIINKYSKFKIPLDWLVVVGSYLSLTISIIGVKAKQSSSIVSNNQIEINRVQPPINQPVANFPSQIQQQPPHTPLMQHHPQQMIETQFFQPQNINMIRPNQLLQQPLHHQQNMNQNQFKQFRYNQPNNNNNNIRSQFNNQDGSFRQPHPYRNQTPNRFITPNINNSNVQNSIESINNNSINNNGNNNDTNNNNNGLVIQDSSAPTLSINEPSNSTETSLNDTNTNDNNNQTKSSLQNDEKDDPSPTESNIVKYFLDIDSSNLIGEDDKVNIQLDKSQIENYLNNDIFDPIKFQLDDDLKSIKNPILTKYEHYLNLKSTYLFNDEYKILIKSYLNDSFFQNIFIKKQFEFDNRKCAKFLDDLFIDLSKNTLKSFQLFDGLFRSNSDYLNNLIDFLIYLINFNHSKAKHDFEDDEEEVANDNENSDSENEEVVKSKKIKLETPHPSLKHNFKSKLIQIRLLKLAIKYMNLLLTKYDEIIAKMLIIDKQIQLQLIHLLNSNKFVSESINLKFLNCLYNSLYFNCGMSHFLNHKNINNQNETSYTLFLDYFVKLKNNNDKKLTTRILFSVSTILTKIKFYESLQLFAVKCHRKYIEKKDDKILTNLVEEFIDLIDKIYKFSQKSRLKKHNMTTNNDYDNLMTEFNQLKKSISEEENENENEVEEEEEENMDEEIENLSIKFNSYPLQNMFDSSYSFNNSYGSITYSHLLRLFDQMHTFKYLMVLWSNVQDSINTKSTSRLIDLNNLIEQFLLNILTPSNMNNFSHAGLEYMLNNSNLSNTMINILIAKLSPMILKLTYSLKLLSQFDLLIFNLNEIKTTTDFNRMSFLTFESNDCLQIISPLLKLDYKRVDLTQTTSSYLVDILSGPDGNMSNKYLKCLIDWFEFLIDDSNLEIAEDQHQQLEDEEEEENMKLLNSSRCFMVNSIGDIFYSLCKLNKKWGLPLVNKTISKSSEKNTSYCCSDNLIRMNKLTSLLINNLVITKYRPSINKNQSYFLLLEKLKSIRTFIEQLVLAMTSQNKSLIKSSKSKTNGFIDKLATDLAIRSSYYFKITFLNNLIDSFQTSIDKNINLFFFKQFFLTIVRKPTQGMPNPHSINADNITINRKIQIQSTDINNLGLMNKLKVNYLNSSLVQLCLFKNLIQHDNDIIGDLNESFNSKFYLGHLISRNFSSILVNYISKLNDYLNLYFFTSDNYNENYDNNVLTFDSNQLDMVLDLCEPTIFLLRIMLDNLIKIRAEKYNDTTALPILFRFYGLFNFIVRSSLDKIKNNLTDDLYSKRNNLLHDIMNEKFMKINTYLLEIFSSYTQIKLKFDPINDTPKLVKEKLRSSLTSRMYAELARYTIDIPHNFIYGINLLLELLPVPLPILVLSKSNADEEKTTDLQILNQRKMLSDYLEPLFMNESINSLNLFTEVQNNDEYPMFVTMIRVLSLSTRKTKLNNLFKRICLKLSDLSEKLCSYLLKTLLDFAIELFNSLKKNNDSIQIEIESNDIGLTTTTQTDNINTIITTDNNLENNDNDNVEINNDTNDDSIYDTDEPNNNNKIEQNGDSIDDETSKILFDVNEPIIKEEIQPAEQLKETDQQNLNEVIENKENPIDNSYIKTILNMNFSKLIQFIIDLIKYERNNCEINIIRTKFYHLVQDTNNVKSKKLRNYSKFLTEFIKFTNHVDVNQTSTQDQTFSIFQESCFSLIEAFLRYLPNFFIENLHNDSLEDDKTTEQPIFDSELIIKSLIDHLTYNKIESIQTTNNVINCLILIYKQYSLSKYHLKLNNSNSMFNFINELNSLVQNNMKSEALTPILDLLTKFYVYINLIIDDLSSSNSIFKLKQIFKWSNTNTNELLIDSISTSNQTFFSNNQHCLINLDKSIESLQASLNKDDVFMNKKYKFLFSHSKRLIKILNELEFEENTNVNLYSNIVNVNLKTEIDSIYSFNANLKNYKTPSREDLKSFFFKRNVYKYVQDKNDLKLFENEWINTICNDEIEDITEINLDFIIKTTFKNWPNQMVSCLIKDENLFRILASTSNLEQQLDQLNQTNSDDIGDKTNGSQNNELAAKSDSSDPLKKSNKNNEVINTRTGVRYKAPMRGGHNAATRNNQTLSNGSAVQNQNGVGLMNPPSIIPQPNQGQIIRHDSFRSRPPNTSRPPSVHVDDYYRLESQKQQQQNQINFNNQNQGIVQMEQAHINQPLVFLNVLSLKFC